MSEKGKIFFSVNDLFDTIKAIKFSETQIRLRGDDIKHNSVDYSWNVSRVKGKL